VPTVFLMLKESLCMPAKMVMMVRIEMKIMGRVP
jgi:hypothetical protein